MVWGLLPEKHNRPGIEVDAGRRQDEWAIQDSNL